MLAFDVYVHRVSTDVPVEDYSAGLDHAPRRSSLPMSTNGLQDITVRLYLPLRKRLIIALTGSDIQFVDNRLWYSYIQR